jgi:hypothetical protein
MHRPEFQIARKHRPVLEVSFSGGPNGVAVSLPSREDGNRSGFRNTVFSSYLEFGTMGAVQKLSESESVENVFTPATLTQLECRFAS